MTTFKVGEIVVLNSGGPKMTIIEVSHSRVKAAWVDDDDKLEIAWLPCECVFLFEGS